jgi:hypothetical protein
MRIASSLPVLALALAACSSAPAPSPMGTAPASIAAAPTAPPAAERAPLPAPVDEGTLRESDASRDPFRAYTDRAPTPPPEDIRPRKARRADIEELKVVGVVTRTAVPRAVLVDARGKGWIVAPGDLVGRRELRSSGPASWRVDRIREREVILVREDLEQTGATKVLAMREDPALSQDD